MSFGEPGMGPAYASGELQNRGMLPQRIGRPASAGAAEGGFLPSVGNQTPAAIMLEKVNLHLEALRRPTNNHELEVHLARQALTGLYSAISKDSGETVAAMRLHRKSQAENKVLRERMLMLEKDLKSKQRALDETSKTVAELFDRLTQNDMAIKAKERLTKENEKLRAQCAELNRLAVKEREDGEAKYRELQKRMDLRRDRERNIKDYMYLVQASVDRQDAIRKIRATGRAKNVSGDFGESSQNAEIYEYTIKTLTGDRKGAATTANVCVTLYGANNKSDLMRLENDVNNFQRGREDTFKIYLPENLGELREIAIEHDDGGPAPGWFLESCTVSAAAQKDVAFECGQWLSKQQGDGKIVRKLNAGANSSETVGYKVTVVTGSTRGAGTDANVSMTLSGAKNSSGPQKLESGANDFEKAAEDHFSFECLDLGKLSKLKISHDGEGENAAWFLDRVIVAAEGQSPVVFPCYEWLDKDSKDGYTERTLEPGDGARPELTTYRVTVVTGSERGSGTDANVKIKIKGTNSETNALPLESGAENFEKGATDMFTLKADDLGKIQHIDISHDNSGDAAAWFLDRVVIVDETTGNESVFRYVSWLKDDTLEARLFAGGDPPPPPVEYKIMVKTGDVRGAGTDAGVFLQLFGHDGEETAEVSLESSVEDFEKGRTDTFTKKLQDVGKIKKLRIRSDNTSDGPAWFLDNVAIEVQGARYDFPCGRWLRESEAADDGYELSRELFEDDIDPRDLLVEYEVVVQTGDMKGAGTNASVDIVMYGSQGNSGSRRLESGSDEFEKGQKDVFTIQGEDLGELQRIKIGHDNTSPAPAWFCESVTITNLKSGQKKELIIQEWFDKAKGDGRISRDIKVGGPGPKKKTKYRVRTFTNKLKGAGTDATVVINLFGSTGEASGDMKLESGANDFEKGQTDEFILEVPDIGERVQKIRIGHDNTNKFPAWLLDQVTVENLSKSPIQLLNFPVYRWLSQDEGDRLTTIDVEAVAVDPSFRPIVPWTITVKTADERGAGTDADMFIKIFGKKNGSSAVSDNLSLESGKDDFEKGHTDTFSVETKDLGQIEKIRIGHNGSKRGSGWKCDSVEVKDAETGTAIQFPVSRWFDVDADDGLIVRDLVVGQAAGGGADKSIPYEIEVITGSKRASGTDASVSIELIGEADFTGKIVLENSRDNFEKGKTDVFKTSANDVGELQKIRIGHNGSGLGSGWFLEQVNVTNTNTGKVWGFGVNRWLAEDEDDGNTIRELVPGGAIELKNYHICVVTGNVRGAGTDANVTAVLYGANGTNSGERKLETSGNNFEKNNRDLFIVECADLTGIEKMRIGHDGNGIGAGWYLGSIEIWEEGFETNKVIFPCERWLAKDEDDGSIVRVLTKDSGTEVVNTTYEVTVYTGAIKGAGTDANVSISMHGDSQISGDRKLSTNKDNFERGKIDTFQLKLPTLGPLKKITIGHDGSGFGSGWFVDKVMISDLSNPKQPPWYFPAFRWLDEGEGDGAISVLVDAASPDDLVGGQPSTYTVTVLTGNRRGAGTDANVFIEMVGETNNEESGRIMLESSRSNFEKGKTDEFHITSPNVGPLKLIRIGHDGGGWGAGWYLSRVIVKDDMTNDSWAFVCNKWLDKKPSEDNPDGLTVRELLPASKDDQQDDGAVGDFFRLDVITGDRRGAGTDANVFVELVGEKASSGTKTLDARRSDFERGNTDTFRLEVSTAIGMLKKLRIGHDNAGWNSGWYLEQVMVTNERTGVKENFSCQRWLDKKEDDGQIIRELLPGEAAGQRLLNYKVLVKTGDRRGGGTSARVFMNIIGSDGETGDRPLDSKRSNFSRASEDDFLIEAVDIGEVQKIRIGHDNKGLTPAWYLDNISISNAADPTKVLEFNCDRWLARDEDDKMIVRELVPAGDEATLHTPGAVQYTVEVHTGDVKYAGTDANVTIQIFGGAGDTGTRQLQNKWKNDFERGHVDIFAVEAADLGELERVRIGHDGTGFGAGWHLDKVVVKRPEAEDIVFECGRWLDQKQEDGLTERELFPEGSGRQSTSTRANETNLVKYKVSVHTSDVYGAGTDAKIQLQLMGTEGSSTKVELNNGRGKFERSCRDELTVEASELGALEKISIGHDNGGFGAGWMLDSVTVSHDGPGELKGTVYYFACGRWLDTDEDDGLTERLLTAGDPPE